jgi:hypothetical protein
MLLHNILTFDDAVLNRTLYVIALNSLHWINFVSCTVDLLINKCFYNQINNIFQILITFACHVHFITYTVIFLRS